MDGVPGLTGEGCLEIGWDIVKIFALYNIKGGVGKTASAVNLAYLSSVKGHRTLVWDLDPQGAATFYFRVKPKLAGGSRKLLQSKKKSPLRKQIRGSDFELLDLVPADFSIRNLDVELEGTKKPSERLARLLEPLEDEYDHVFLDCAPSISLTSESIFAAADVLLVPTIPTPLSVRTLEQLDRHLAEEGDGLDLRVLPFMCMVDRRKKMHRAAEDLALELQGSLQRVEPFLDARIPYSSTVEHMGVERAPVASFAYRSSANRAYRALWDSIEQRIGI